MHLGTVKENAERSKLNRKKRSSNSKKPLLNQTQFLKPTRRSNSFYESAYLFVATTDSHNLFPKRGKNLSRANNLSLLRLCCKS